MCSFSHMAFLIGQLSFGKKLGKINGKQGSHKSIVLFKMIFILPHSIEFYLMGYRQIIFNIKLNLDYTKIIK